jgi:hypothetical protein
MIAGSNHHHTPVHLASKDIFHEYATDFAKSQRHGQRQTPRSRCCLPVPWCLLSSCSEAVNKGTLTVGTVWWPTTMARTRRWLLWVRSFLRHEPYAAGLAHNHGGGKAILERLQEF